MGAILLKIVGGQLGVKPI